MIKEYREYLVLIINMTQKLGMTLYKDTDFVANFRRDDGWELYFEGEQHVRPLIELALIPPKQKKAFSLRILMKIYEESTGTKIKNPTLSNQLAFLLEHFDDWLSNMENYNTRYETLNSVLDL